MKKSKGRNKGKTDLRRNMKKYSEFFCSKQGQGRRKLKLFPVLMILALATSHDKYCVVNAADGDESGGNGDKLMVIDDHDTSVVEFVSEERALHRHRHHFAEESDDDYDDYDNNDCETETETDNNYNSKNDNIWSNKNQDVIIVVSVDGTLAGVSKESGKVLWKQSRKLAEDTQQTRAMKPNKSKSDSSQARLLQPLVSTTTTTKSASTSDYAVVPSVDGNVYVTSNEVTVTTSVKELALRAPFLDNKGRFYVGSRQATAAAIDVDTGEILRIVSATEVPLQEIKSLEGRNTIWVGRVDYSVSVQDTRTGMADAQFSVANIMSVSDMRGSREAESWRSGKHQNQNSSPTVPSGNAFKQQLRVLPGLNDESSALIASDGGPSALVATPSGNLAYRDVEKGELRWVADSSFDSPIVFAMDADSGFSLGVDIIPDVPVPNSSLEYLSREMERQLELIQEQQLEQQDQTIVGAMANGQLYALPLGPQAPLPNTASLQQQYTSVASLSATSNAMHIPKVPQITGGRTNVHSQAQDGKQILTTKKHCDPLSPQFPACLVGNHPNNQQHQQLQQYYQHRVDHHSKESHSNIPPQDASSGGKSNANYDSVAIMPEPYNQGGGFYHPDFGYVSAQDLQRIQHRPQPRSGKHAFFRIMGSWLPPTIALIFVLSFELGRRKRLKDNQKAADQHNQLVHTEESSSHDEAVPLHVQQHVIQVSDEVLGYGGQGTVVYKGMLDGRSVAVKRMLSAYHANADREISLLIESDGHPNVVRYFLKEIRGDFVYLALELCSLSLHDLIGVLRQRSELVPPDERKSAIFEATKLILLQIASGVKHLHTLRIVHRDLKPANILLAISRRGQADATEEDQVLEAFMKGLYVAKISDMGLGKQLVGQSSLGASLIAESSFRGSKPGASSVGVGPGSVGWQAPEVMAARWTASDASARSGDSSNGIFAENSLTDTTPNQRTSRSVDIFSLGCIFYSTLVPGNHPFGEWYEREANIMHNRPKLEPLKALSPEAYDLVSRMLNRVPRLRPTAKEICEHPFFWPAQKRMTFLCEFSDRLETDACAESSQLVLNSLAIERGASDVVGTGWDKRLDGGLISNVQKFRTYDPSSARDLLRLIRNKHHHFDELPAEFKEENARNQDAFLEYFEARFPLLLMHCFDCCRQLMSKTDPFAMKYCIVPHVALEPSSSQAVAIPQLPNSSQVGKGDKKVETAPSIQISDSTTANYPVVSNGEINEGRIPASNKIEEIAYIPTQTNADEDDQTSPLQESLENEKEFFHSTSLDNIEAADDIIAWEGSTAARAFNCRGWSRSEDEWTTRIDPVFRKRDQNLKRAEEDPKFRTRLCNHWDESLGTFCPMRKKNKCVFAHGPVELRVKEPKKNRWGKLVDKNGNNSNPQHSGGEDTYGAARSIESARKVEGKWNTPRKGAAKGKKHTQPSKKKAATQEQS